MDPAGRVATDHQRLIINARVAIGRLGFKQCIDDAQDLVPERDDGALVSPTKHKPRIGTVKLAVGAPRAALATSHRTRRRVRFSLRVRVFFILAGALMIPGAHAAPGAQLLHAAKALHVHTDLDP